MTVTTVPREVVVLSGLGGESMAWSRSLRGGTAPSLGSSILTKEAARQEPPLQRRPTVSFATIPERPVSLAHAGVERCGLGEGPRERASDDLLSGWGCCLDRPKPSSAARADSRARPARPQDSHCRERRPATPPVRRSARCLS